MADLYRIYRAFQEAGYLEVPDYYDKTRKSVCRICGWENMDGHNATCSRCTFRKGQEGKQGKTIRGLPVASMSIQDYVIFRAIAEHKTDDIKLEVTIDDYANEVKARNAERMRQHEEKAQAQRQYETALFD